MQNYTILGLTHYTTSHSVPLLNTVAVGLPTAYYTFINLLK